MKKALTYGLLAIVLVAAILLVFTGNNSRSRQLDERMSFRKKDKIPYGTYVAFESLKHLFNKASVSVNSNSPGNWDSLSLYESGQALIIVSPWFFADEFEMKKLIRFVEGGNDVLISSAIVSDDVKSALNCGVGRNSQEDDTLKVRLNKPPFAANGTYRYPGKRFDSHFYGLDSTITTGLGTGRDADTNFIHLKAGRGNLYFHLAPMTFTNYFLLRQKNIRYLEDVLSVIPADTRKVVWDEYYLSKRHMYDSPDNESSKGWLSALWSYREFRWALIVALLVLLLYVLLEMRRKQRFIPVITRPRNDSMDFVKTIGRLYYDKGDHKNLCRKMAAYFLEHVRNRYKLATGDLNNDFIKNLQFKSGVEEEQIKPIVHFIKALEHFPSVTEQQLAKFHKQLEYFYSKT